MGLTRTRIRELLDVHDLGPSRALGQNFLCDPAMVDKIVRISGVGPGSAVVEVGPGLGSLTLGLCQSGATVTAIEVDRYLMTPLQEVTAEYLAAGRLNIVNADAMDLDWSAVLAPSPSWSVVANLPYNIATPLVLDLLADQSVLQNWVVMVQREAGERLVADPGSKIYGIPSVLLAFWADAQLAGSVPADVFLPRPKVESVLVKITRRPEPAVSHPQGYEQFAKLVRTAFGKRRKMLRGSIGHLVSADDFARSGVDPTWRPEQLALEHWSQLTEQTLGTVTP